MLALMKTSRLIIHVLRNFLCTFPTFGFGRLILVNLFDAPEEYQLSSAKYDVYFRIALTGTRDLNLLENYFSKILSFCEIKWKKLLAWHLFLEVFHSKEDPLCCKHKYSTIILRIHQIEYLHVLYFACSARDSAGCGARDSTDERPRVLCARAAAHADRVERYSGGAISQQHSHGADAGARLPVLLCVRASRRLPLERLVQTAHSARELLADLFPRGVRVAHAAARRAALPARVSLGLRRSEDQLVGAAAHVAHQSGDRGALRVGSGVSIDSAHVAHLRAGHRSKSHSRNVHQRRPTQLHQHDELCHGSTARRQLRTRDAPAPMGARPLRQLRALHSAHHFQRASHRRNQEEHCASRATPTLQQRQHHIEHHIEQQQQQQQWQQQQLQQCRRQQEAEASSAPRRLAKHDSDARHSAVHFAGSRSAAGPHASRADAELHVRVGPVEAQLHEARGAAQRAHSGELPGQPAHLLRDEPPLPARVPAPTARPLLLPLVDPVLQPERVAAFDGAALLRARLPPDSHRSCRERRLCQWQREQRKRTREGKSRRPTGHLAR